MVYGFHWLLWLHIHTQIKCLHRKPGKQTLFCFHVNKYIVKWVNSSSLVSVPLFMPIVLISNGYQISFYDNLSVKGTSAIFTCYNNYNEM